MTELADGRETGPGFACNGAETQGFPTLLERSDSVPHAGFRVELPRLVRGIIRDHPYSPGVSA